MKKSSGYAESWGHTPDSESSASWVSPIRPERRRVRVLPRHDDSSWSYFSNRDPSSLLELLKNGLEKLPRTVYTVHAHRYSLQVVHASAGCQASFSFEILENRAQEGVKSSPFLYVCRLKRVHNRFPVLTDGFIRHTERFFIEGVAKEEKKGENENRKKGQNHDIRCIYI